MTVAYTIGRILIPLMFLVEGVRRLIDIGAFAKGLEASGISIPDEIVQLLSYVGNPSKYEALGYLIVAVEIICGLMVLIGLKARWAALILVAYIACTIIFVHPFWEGGPDQIANRTEALKDLAIMGGLLLVVAVGSGPGSMERR
jgi:putative oxidoreductase